MTSNGQMKLQRYLAIQAKTYVYKPMNLTQTCTHDNFTGTFQFLGNWHTTSGDYITPVYVFSHGKTKTSFLIIPN